MYFKQDYKLIAIDLSKQQTLDEYNEYNELNLVEIGIEQEIQRCFLFLKKKIYILDFQRELG